MQANDVEKNISTIQSVPGMNILKSFIAEKNLPNLLLKYINQDIEKIQILEDTSMMILFFYYSHLATFVNDMYAFINLVDDIMKHNPNVSAKKLSVLYLCLNRMKANRHHFIFGGFLRDLYTDDDFSDVDVWCAYKWGAYIDIDGFNRETLQKGQKTDHYMLQSEHWKQKYSDSDLEFTLDITLGGAFHQLGMDYQCNSLYIRQVSMPNAFPSRYMIATRFSDPEVPKITKDGKFMYVPDGNCIIFDETQMSHHDIKWNIISLLEEAKLYYRKMENGEDVKCLQDALERAKKYEQYKIPDLETIIGQIKKKELHDVNYSKQTITERRLEHMQEKGYRYG